VLLVGPPTVHLERSRRQLTEFGFEVVLVSYHEPHPDAVAHLALVPGGQRWRTIWTLGKARRQLARVVRDVRPDVVHAHWLACPGWIAALAGCDPLIVSVWGSDALRWTPASRLARVLARIVGRRAVALTYDADVVRQALVAFGVPDERLVRLVFGVDVTRFHPGPPDHALLSALGVLTDGPVVLSPRGLDPVYCPETIVEGFARVARRYRASLLVRVGDISDERLEGLMRIAATHEVGELVIPYTGVADDDLPALLRSVDAVVSVPESDATSVLLLEALACATPVIVSDLPANREWVTERVAPIIPVGDAAALADALEAVLGTGGARERMLLVAAHVREVASTERQSEILRSLYATIAG
jgi:glycosyltransferase involved in cell wall biosynthesis